MNLVLRGQPQRQRRRHLWCLRMAAQVAAAMIVVVSFLPSTNAFATCHSCLETALGSRFQSSSRYRYNQDANRKRNRKRKRTTALSSDNKNTREEDSFVVDPSSSRSSSSSRMGDQPEPPPTAYVLKERNPYDVHVYYKSPQERAAAMELRHTMQTEFGDWMRFYTPKDRPIGPHPVPMWEADFGAYEHRHKWATVLDFLQTHNPQQLSILIHPHSTDGDYADHTEHAVWVGEALDLRIQGWRR